jgi:hypothetical protein
MYRDEDKIFFTAGNQLLLSSSSFFTDVLVLVTLGKPTVPCHFLQRILPSFQGVI